MNSASAKRIDIISDTHGYLSPALLDELEGADLIIHAGDLTSEMDYEHLCTIAPVRAVLGNNDYYRDYGPDVDRLALFTYEGLKFAVKSAVFPDPTPPVIPITFISCSFIFLFCYFASYQLMPT